MTSYISPKGVHYDLSGSIGLDSWTLPWHQAWLGAYGLTLSRLGNPQDNSRLCTVREQRQGSVQSRPANYFTQAGYEVGTLPHPILLTSRERISLTAQDDSRRDLRSVNREACGLNVYQKRQSMKCRTELKLSQSWCSSYWVRSILWYRIYWSWNGGLQRDSTNLFKPLAVLCPSVKFGNPSVILGNTMCWNCSRKAGVFEWGSLLFMRLTAGWRRKRSTRCA